MRRPLTLWAAGIGSLVVADIVADRARPDCTLSACTRLIYRTHTPLGRCAFLASYAAFSAWYLPHILKQARRLS